MTVSELITFKGETDGASTTGDFTLKSDIIYGSISYIRIPAGMKAKIWAKRISGNPVTLKIYYTHDVTVTSPTWEEIGSEYLSAEGEKSLEKRRPIIARGFTGKEAIKFSWEQATAAESHVAIDVEFTDED